MFYLQKIISAATMIIEIFVYKSEPILPYHIAEIECNNNYTIGKKCLDADMDSVFFV
jgi:hypothetical protein